MHRAHDHPLFTLVYRGLAGVGEHVGLGEARSRLLAGASGRVLVVGLGPGHDLEHLPAAVTSVVGVEPAASMRAAAAPRVAETAARGIDVTVVDAMAEGLPFGPREFDAVLFALVLCSVEDVGAALSEARRVLRADGRLLLLEHVRARPGTVTAAAQRLVAPVWPRLAGGCRVDRDTRAAVVAAGFDDSELRDTVVRHVPVVAPTLVGSARVRRAAG